MLLLPDTLDNQTDGVSIADGCMRGRAWEEEHLALADEDVLEAYWTGMVNAVLVMGYSQSHVALHLIEPFLREQLARKESHIDMKHLGFIDVKVSSGIGPTHHHHDKVLAKMNALIVHGRFQELLVLIEPTLEVDGRR